MFKEKSVLQLRTERLERLAQARGESNLVLGTYRDLTKEQMDAEGIYEASSTFLHCREERTNCVRDGALLGEEVRNQNGVYKRCPTCKTLYYFVSKTDS